MGAFKPAEGVRHFVNPDGAWFKQVPPGEKPLSFFEKSGCALADKPGKRSYLQCLSSDEFIKDVFMDSDTDMIVLSFVPSRRDAQPLTIEEAATTAAIVERMEGTHRLLVHGRVNPNQDGDIQGMDELAEHWKVSAWKTYTQWVRTAKVFSERRHRPRLHRQGAQTQHQEYLRAQGHSIWQTIL